MQVFCGEPRSTEITKCTLLGKSQLEHSTFREKEINKREKPRQGICQEGAVAFPLFRRFEQLPGSSLMIHAFLVKGAFPHLQGICVTFYRYNSWPYQDWGTVFKPSAVGVPLLLNHLRSLAGVFIFYSTPRGLLGGRGGGSQLIQKKQQPLRCIMN